MALIKLWSEESNLISFLEYSQIRVEDFTVFRVKCKFHGTLDYFLFRIFRSLYYFLSQVSLLNEVIICK